MASRRAATSLTCASLFALIYIYIHIYIYIYVYIYIFIYIYIYIYVYIYVYAYTAFTHRVCDLFFFHTRYPHLRLKPSIYTPRQARADPSVSRRSGEPRVNPAPHTNTRIVREPCHPRGYPGACMPFSMPFMPQTHTVPGIRLGPDLPRGQLT